MSNLNIKCLYCLTFLCEFLGILSIFVTNNNWFKLASLSMIIAVAILGNVLTYIHIVRLSKYCGLSKTILYFSNIITHIIIPILLYKLIHKGWLVNSTYDRYITTNALIFSVLIGVIYFILMLLNITCTYGLELKHNIIYGLCWLAIVYLSIHLL